MVTDTERREVARSLREIELSKGGCVVWWRIAKALKLKQLDGWFGWEKFDPDSAKRLADLIDPDCEEGRYSVARTVRPVDREALLALAQSMKVRSSWLSASDAARARRIADRIREALGVVA